MLKVQLHFAILSTTVDSMEYTS